MLWLVARATLLNSWFLLSDCGLAQVRWAGSTPRLCQSGPALCWAGLASLAGGQWSVWWATVHGRVRRGVALVLVVLWLVARGRCTSRGPGDPACLDLRVLPADHPGPRGFSFHLTLQSGVGPPPRGPTSAPPPSSGLASPSSSSTAEGSLPPPGLRTAVDTTTATLVLVSTTFHSCT